MLCFPSRCTIHLRLQALMEVSIFGTRTVNKDWRSISPFDYSNISPILCWSRVINALFLSIFSTRFLKLNNLIAGNHLCSSLWTTNNNINSIISLWTTNNIFMTNYCETNKREPFLNLGATRSSVLGCVMTLRSEASLTQYKWVLYKWYKWRNCMPFPFHWLQLGIV